MKYKLFALALFMNIMYLNSLSQPVIKAQKVAGGNDADDFTDMWLTKDRGLIVGGYSNSDKSAEKSQNSRGGYDYWVIKYDSCLRIEWGKTIGGNNDDDLYALQQTQDGGYFLGGLSYSDSSYEKTQNSRGLSDCWIVKLNANGKIQWDETIGGDYYDYLTCLQQTSDEGYILGVVSESDSSGEKTENSRGSADYWIVKLDKTGKIQWDKTIGGNDDDEIRSLKQTSDGGYIVGGYSRSEPSGEKTQNCRGGFDYWIVKLDKLGNIEWTKTIGGNKDDYLTSVQQTNDGGYILGGYSSSNISAEKTQNNRCGCDADFSPDFWIVKLDASGQIEWDKTIGGSNWDFLRSIQQTSDDGYVMSGSSYSDISGEKTENGRGFGDYWIVKLDTKGEVQWDKTVGGNNQDEARSIKEVRKNIYAVGGFSLSDVSGDKSKRSRGFYDYWMVGLKYEEPSPSITSLESADSLIASKSHNKNFSVYPNPVQNVVNIRINGKATLTLTDLSGKILLTKTLEGNGEINVSHLSAGLYYLKNNSTGETKKVIISR